jgi:hypothetical protein
LQGFSSCKHQDQPRCIYFIFSANFK